MYQMEVEANDSFLAYFTKVSLCDLVPVFVSFYLYVTSINLWMPELVFMKLGM
jgi:hypothetical protein